MIYSNPPPLQDDPTVLTLLLFWNWWSCRLSGRRRRCSCLQSFSLESRNWNNRIKDYHNNGYIVTLLGWSSYLSITFSTLSWRRSCLSLLISISKPRKKLWICYVISNLSCNRNVMNETVIYDNPLTQFFFDFFSRFLNLFLVHIGNSLIVFFTEVLCNQWNQYFILP